MMNRRQALQTTALIATTAAVLPTALAQPATPPSVAPPLFTLPPLPYALDALEPHLDARTMEIHYSRHHQAYVTNANKALETWPEYRTSKLAGNSEQTLRLLASVPESIRTAIRNNLGGHYNHSLFWQMLKPGGGGEPTGELRTALETHFNNFTNFKTAFTEAATKVFGSGWAWLVLTADRKLAVQSTPNQDSPIMSPAAETQSERPKTEVLLGLDVWEHAYYLKYQNKRADYITAWWQVVNWDFVRERFARFHRQ